MTRRGIFILAATMAVMCVTALSAQRSETAKEIKADLEAQRVTKEAPCPKCKTMNSVRTPFGFTTQPA